MSAASNMDMLVLAYIDAQRFHLCRMNGRYYTDCHLHKNGLFELLQKTSKYHNAVVNQQSLSWFQRLIITVHQQIIQSADKHKCC